MGRDKRTFWEGKRLHQPICPDCQTDLLCVDEQTERVSLYMCSDCEKQWFDFEVSDEREIQGIPEVSEE